MAKAFGIVNFAGNHIRVEGMQEYRPVGAFSFLDVIVLLTSLSQI